MISGQANGNDPETKSWTMKGWAISGQELVPLMPVQRQETRREKR